MKKLSILFAAVLTSVSSIFAADEVYKTISFDSLNVTRGENVQNYTKTWKSATNGFEVSIANFNNNNWNYKWEWIKAGPKGDTNNISTITTTKTIDKAITKVVVTIDAIANGSVTATTFEAATDTNFTKDVVTVSPADYSKAGEWEYVLTSTAENKYYRLSFTCNNTTKSDKTGKNGVITLSKIEYYVAVPDVDATAIQLDETELSLEQYKSTVLAATLTPANATTEIVWSSEDEKVATVKNGQVTAVGIGETIITATAGTVSAKCTVTVTAATPITVAQAVEIAKTVSADNEIAAGGKYTIRGYVTALEGTPSEDLSKYGNYSVWLADAKDGGKVFEAFRVVPIDGNTIVAVGDLVEVVGDITKYNTTYETAAGGTIRIIGTETAIDNTTATKTATKRIENGTLVIEKNGIRYNALGTVVE